MAYTTPEARAKHAEEQRRWRERHPDRNAEILRRYRLRHPEKANSDHKRRKANPGKRRAWRQREKSLYPEKYRARKTLYEHVSRGTLKRPDSCSQCGIKCKPEGHHPDYSKRLEVIWLCHRCHRKFHDIALAAAVGNDPGSEK
jgi:hypothetical protein